MKSSTSMMSSFGKTAVLTLVLAMSGIVAFAQSKTVSGTIVDDLGEPVLGANVVIDGTLSNKCN